jgi:hypothetical protein
MAKGSRGFGTGKPRGSRGRGRGKGFAQSGGIANSYADTKQGAGSLRGYGGGSQDSVIGATTRRGDKVTVRTPAGDKHKSGQSRSNGATTGGVKRGAPTTLSGAPKPKVSGKTSLPYAKVNKGAIRGRGGSNG